MTEQNHSPMANTINSAIVDDSLTGITNENMDSDYMTSLDGSLEPIFDDDSFNVTPSLTGTIDMPSGSYFVTPTSGDIKTVQVERLASFQLSKYLKNQCLILGHY